MKNNGVNYRALKLLKECKEDLTRQEYKTLRGQILAGEDKAAMRGLEKIQRRNQKKWEKYTQDTMPSDFFE